MNAGFAQYVQLLFIAIVLIAGPLRASPVFDCAMLDTEVQGPCCCTDEGPPPCNEFEQTGAAHDPDADCVCCKAEMQAAYEAGAPAIPAGSETEPIATAPPPEQPLAAPAARPATLLPPPVERRSAANTYLLTARLRL